MKRLCRGLLILWLSLAAVGCAQADVRVGLHFSSYPDLVPVPGYPVYYAPQVSANYFFYDGDYWLLDDDGWYRSDWYDGPWVYVEPDFVPFFVLRVPVRYYRAPPPYFRGWYYDAPPRWGYYWGPTWERRHYGWDRWDRARIPALAPLPLYQRNYIGNRYPGRDIQRELHDRNYHYRPQHRDRDDRRDHDRDDQRPPFAQPGSRDDDRNHYGNDRYDNDRSDRIRSDRVRNDRDLNDRERSDWRDGRPERGGYPRPQGQQFGGQQLQRDDNREVREREVREPVRQRMPVPQPMPREDRPVRVSEPPRAVQNTDRMRSNMRESGGWQRGGPADAERPRPQMRDVQPQQRERFNGGNRGDGGERGGHGGRDR